MAYPTQQCITLFARQAKYLPGVPELRERMSFNGRLNKLTIARLAPMRSM